MKIFHISSLIRPLGATTVGGAERFVLDLAAQQVKEGHDVTICALPDSALPTGVKLFSPSAERVAGLEIARDYFLNSLSPEEHTLRAAAEKASYGTLLNALTSHASQIDLIHNHAYDELPLKDLASLQRPTLHTLHLPPCYPWINEALAERAAKHSEIERFVTCSVSVARSYQRQLGFSPGVVYPGMAPIAETSADTVRSGFLWVGRISPEKGLHLAIQIVVERLQLPLKIVGGVYDQDYFRQAIENKLANPLIDYIGELGHSEAIEVMRSAKALIFPVLWDEPFGLVLVEALACGTPVLAFRRGAVAEIVEDGVSGVIADAIEQIATKFRLLETLDGRRCRQSVIDRFSIARCAAEYQAEYERLIGAN